MSVTSPSQALQVEEPAAPSDGDVAPPALKRSKRYYQARVSKYDDPDEVIAQVKGDKYREYRRRFRESGKGALTLDYPLEISIEPIDYCNYGCPYCPRTLDSGSGARFPMETFRRLIDDFIDRTDGVGALCLDRGEPLLDKRLEEMIAYASGKGVMDIIMATNAVFMTRERSRRLIEAGVTKLFVSIDAATQETYTKTRGGDLAQVERNLNDFLEAREELNSVLPLVRASFVVCDLNEHEIGMFEEKWASKVDFVEFQKIVDHSFIDDLKDYDDEPFWCPYPFQSLAFSASGDIRACCSFYNKHLILGDTANGDTIESAFRSPTMEQLRASFRAKSGFHIACKNCRHFKPESDGLLSAKANKPLGKLPSRN